jgi:hypothetical protein
MIRIYWRYFVSERGSIPDRDKNLSRRHPSVHTLLYTQAYIQWELKDFPLN